jgi:carotenoid cleavage dioxygenase-like enzyme
MEATATTTPTATKTAKPADKPGMFLEGNFAPVDREVTVGELTVRGALPTELAGVLMRNGPNPAGEVAAKHHWFIGDAMLHAIRIEGGRARGYRNRWVRTPRVQQAVGLEAAPRSKNDTGAGSGSITVIEHAGRVLALGEVGLPYEVDSDANTLGQYDYAGALRSNMTGHPKLDPVTGELFFFGYDFGPVHLRYHVADASGRLTKTIEIPKAAPTMMHDFAVTATRVVFMDFPVVFDMSMVERGHTMPFRWDEKLGARIGVMRRDGDGSDLKWIEVPPCYVYHVFNAYDVGEQIVLDVVEHPHTFRDREDGPERLDAPPAVRWQIDPVRGEVTRTVLDTRGQEFPRIDPRRVTREHRYGYAVHNAFSSGGAGTLLKHDFKRGTSEMHTFEGDRAPGEGVFVPVGAGEDEGYVLTPVYDAARGTSEIHVVDAQDFASKACAIIELPVRIPFGFHGDFIPSH